VTKHGNPRLRAALVELAWRPVRFQPAYRPVVKWRRVLAKGALATGAARKKAIVAMARQPAVDLWRVRTGRLNPEQLGLSNKPIRGEQKGTKHNAEHLDQTLTLWNVAARLSSNLLRKPSRTSP
jgi:hypothetical protein